jgi:hypothetical protein
MTPKLNINHANVFVGPELVGNDTLVILPALLRPDLLHFMFFKMASAAILDLKEIRMTPKLNNSHANVFVVPELVGNDTFVILLALLGPDILHFMFFKMASAAILDLEVRMTPKLNNN